MKAPRRDCLFLAVLLLWPIFAQAKGFVPPALPEDAIMDRFFGNHPDAGLVTVQRWSCLEVSYREQDGGLSGKLIEIIETGVLDRTDIEEASTVYADDSPRFRLKKVEVLVMRNGDVRRFRRKDLRWMEMTSRSDGVVTLDGTFAYALIPGIRVGDRVRIRREFGVNGIYGLLPQRLGSSRRPYLQTGFEVRLPVGYTLTWGTQGSAASQERLIHTEQLIGGRIVHSWLLSADEDGTLPTCRDRFPRITVTPHVQHAGKYHRDDISCGLDWQQTGNAYLQSIEALFEPSEEMIEHVNEITAGVVDPVEKIDRIYASVQQRCHYLGLFEGAGGIIPVPAKEVFDLGFGDCKGLGTLLISLLRTADIPSYPVLVLTPSAGRLNPGIPSMAQFNHFIVWADDGGGGIFLDGTVDFCPAGLVPTGDAASPVLLLRPDAVELVEIPNTAWDPGESRLKIDGHLDASGLLHLNFSYSVSGNLGVRWRSRLASLGRQEGHKVILKTLIPEGLALQSGEPEVLGMEEWQGLLTMQVTAASNRSLPGNDSGVFLPKTLSPLGWRFDPDVGCEAPLDLRRRLRRFQSWCIELPSGMVLATPDSMTIKAEGLQLKQRVRQEGRMLKLDRDLRFIQDFASGAQVDIMRQAIDEAARLQTGYFELRCQAGN